MISTENCLSCKKIRMLSSEKKCAIHVKLDSLLNSNVLNTNYIQGSSPPGVFVGTSNYPNVSIGPMVPLIQGDTEILDTPELWMGKNFNEIVNFRHSLIRGYKKTHVLDARSGSNFLSQLQELSMTVKPIDSELILSKKPNNILEFDEGSQPFGPIAPLSSFKLTNTSVDQRIEKAFYDNDLNASEAITDLYQNDVIFSRLQRSFSLGMFGLKKRRRIVPTRWSITSVDNILSLKLISMIKNNQSIDEYHVFHYSYLDNVYVVILIPQEWKFEWIEAWFDQSLLASNFPETDFVNEVQMSEYTSSEGYQPVTIGDWESYSGRKTYAKPGGCYYTSRFAVAEYLNSIRKQAGVIILREIRPGYIMPVGVWNVRESLRTLFKQKYESFDSLDKALNHSSTFLEIPKRNWVKCSYLLRQAYYQRKLTDFT